MKIKLSLGYLIAFYCLIGLCGTSHELVHHFVASAICRCWGYKTFNSFNWCESCHTPFALFSTLAGPLFTFGLMWLGVVFMRRADAWSKGFGLALVFANLPINRILITIFSSNDELSLARTFFGNGIFAHLAADLFVLVLGVPPLIIAYRTIPNKHKLLWFLGLFILPMVAVIVTVVPLENLIKNKQFLYQTVIGIPYLVLLYELICTLGYHFYKKRLSLTANTPYLQQV